MQEPRLVAHVLDEAHGLARHVGGLGVLLGDARRQVHVAHLPARHRTVGPVGRDHVVAPRIVGIVALLAQVVGIAALLARRRMAVVAVELLEAAGAHQRRDGRAAFDAVALQPVEVGQHVSLARQRHADAGRPQVVADGLLAQGQRHAVPGGAVREHVAAGVVAHARGAADTRLHIGAREQHALGRQRIDGGRLEMRMAGARQVIGAQLVAHDEQNIFDLAHESSSFDGHGRAGLSKAHDRRARPSAKSSISGSCRSTIPSTASRATSGGPARPSSTPRSASAFRRPSSGRSRAAWITGGSRPTGRWR